MANKNPHPKKKAFLAAYSKTGNVSQAAEIADIDRTTHYDWLKLDEQYAIDFAHAEETAADYLEQEARRRAVEGVDEPVFYQGKQCGAVRKYSDTLLIFLLKGARKEKYADRREHSGPDGNAIEAKIAVTSRTVGMSPEEILALAKELDADDDPDDFLSLEPEGTE